MKVPGQPDKGSLRDRPRMLVISRVKVQVYKQR